MKVLPAKTRQQALMDVLFHALRVTDASLNKNAALVLSQLGGDPVPRLLVEAARRKNRVPHRLRVLAADPDEQIRAAARRCLATCPISES